MSYRQDLLFTDIAVDKIIVSHASEVQVSVRVFDLLTRDADVIQRLGGGGVVEHLLEKKKLSAVVMAHDHLVVAERLPKRMGRHLYIQIKLFGDILENDVDGPHGDWDVLVTPSVGQTAEHIVTETHVRSMLQIKSGCLDDCVVDCDVSVLFPLAGIARLLFKYREAVAERAVLVDKIGEPKHPQVTSPQPEVDAYDEQHIVPVPPVADKMLRDTDDVVHALNGFGRVLRCQLTSRILGGLGDKTGRKLPAHSVPQGVDVDHVVHRNDVHIRILSDKFDSVKMTFRTI